MGQGKLAQDETGKGGEKLSSLYRDGVVVRPITIFFKVIKKFIDPKFEINLTSSKILAREQT